MNRASFLRRAGALLLAPTAAALTRYLPVADPRVQTTLLDYRQIVRTPILESTGERVLITGIYGDTLTVKRNIERHIWIGATST